MLPAYARLALLHTLGLLYIHGIPHVHEANSLIHSLTSNFPEVFFLASAALGIRRTPSFPSTSKHNNRSPSKASNHPLNTKHYQGCPSTLDS